MTPVPLASATADTGAVMARALLVLAERHGWPLWVADADGRCLQANDAMAALAQRPLAELAGHSYAEVFDPAVATMLRAADQTARAQAGPLVSDHAFEWGGRRHEHSVLRVAQQGVLCAVWVDQTAGRARELQLRQALEQLEQQQRANDSLRRELKDQTVRDPASGLQSRAHFDDQLRREVDLSTREHREFALVQIEVDAATLTPLDEVARDRIYEAMGRLLRGNTRAMDASCRIDGGHFAVLLSGVGLATAHSRMEGLRRQCATQIVMHEAQEQRFTVSMGVASFPHTAHTQEELLAACNSALAEARRRGGNHVTLASIRFGGA